MFCHIPVHCTNSVLAAVVLYLCDHPAFRGCVIHLFKMAGIRHLQKNATECLRYVDRVIFYFLFKRTTVKRTCIKVLPSLLVIHLMRFGFDWESGRSIKYDEQIRVRKLLCMVLPTLPCLSRIFLFLFILPSFPHILVLGF